MSVKKNGYRTVQNPRIFTALYALLLAGILSVGALTFLSCQRDSTQDSASPSDAQEITETGDEVHPLPDGVKAESAAKSTMYADSLADAFGAVTRITLYAKDNPGLPYDVIADRNGLERCYYVFLPSTLDQSAVRVRALHEDGTETGVYTLDFTTDTEYGVKTQRDIYFKVIPKQSKIPTLMIQIDESAGSILSMDGDSAHDTYCYGDMTLLVPRDLARERGWKTETVSRENNHSQTGTMKMRGRGNWTWNQPKKPYQITLEKSESLLGMGDAKNYLLLANVMDASLLRNQVLYDLATDMGLAYSPDIEPVDVFLNGEYIGQYSLSEKVEVGESRVDIDEDKDFLIELDHYAHNEIYTFTTAHNKTFTLHNQENTDSAKQARRLINQVEETIYDHDSTDYRNHLDEESFIRFWWIQDLSRNNDSFIGSNFFYYVYDEEKLYAGPIWDMDNTFGIWGGGVNLKRDGWHNIDRGWLKHLYQNDDFYRALMDYFNDEAAVLFQKLPDKIDAYADYIKESAEMNYLVNDRTLFVNTGTETWEEDIEYLKDFIRDRVSWYLKEVPIY